MSKRVIVHMDLDSFFVSVERLKDPSLIGKPVIVGGKDGRGVVSSCSYEARKFGVHSAMPIQKAMRLCPDASVVSSMNGGDYSHYSSLVTEIIRQEVPLYQKSSIDEFYIDLSGLDEYYDSYELATHIRTRITKEIGLPISFGYASSKTVAKIATGEAKPDGQLKIEHGSEKEFLAPLSIKEIPMAGKKTREALNALGILFIKDIQNKDQSFFETRFGKQGVLLWNKANGICNSKVVPFYQRKSISTERTFQVDTQNVVMLEAVIVSMAEKLGHLLRKEETLAGCVAIKIRYKDFQTQSQQLTIQSTNIDQQLIDYAKQLFDQLYQSQRKVRLIGIRCSHLKQGGAQINLFDNSENQEKLYGAIDTIKSKYGLNSIKRASGIKYKNHKFNPFGKE